MKFFHTSGTRFKVGDLIGGPGKSVFMSNNAIPHGTIMPIVEGGFKSWKEYSNFDSEAIYNKYWDDKALGLDPKWPILISKKQVKVYVYEVKPHGKIYFGSYDEWVTKKSFVEVIRIVGNARGILQNAKIKYKENVYRVAIARKRK